MIDKISNEVTFKYENSCQQNNSSSVIENGKGWKEMVMNMDRNWR